MISQLVLNLAVLGSTLVVVGSTMAEEYVVAVGGPVAVSAPKTESPSTPPLTATVQFPSPSITPSTTQVATPVAPPRETRTAAESTSGPRILPRPASPFFPVTKAEPLTPQSVADSGLPSQAPATPVPTSPVPTSPVPDSPVPISPTQVPEPVSECALQAAGDLTVVTFNTHRSYGPGGLEKIADELSGLDPDVVLLQEVDRFYSRTGRVDQVGWFAQRLGMNSAFGANVRHGRSQYGTAILSRAPILEQANTLLPNGPGGEQRGLLRVVIDLGQVSISVYNTHLQNRLVGLREAQSRAVAGILASDPGPKIIGGDFNAGAGTPTLNSLAAHVVDSWPRAGLGPDGTGPGGSRIDYLMASPGLRPLRSTVHRGGVSDHAALRTEYAVATPSSC